MTTSWPGSREEHLARCKQHALAYLDAGDVRLAWLSMTSDVRRHTGTDAPATSMLLGDEGLPCVQDGDAEELWRLIEGFR